MAAKNKSMKRPAVDNRKLEQWIRQGKALNVSSHQWAIAKWILRGEEIFKSKKKAYNKAAELTGLSRETLQQFAHTARNVKALTRVKELTFGHHRLVSKLKEQEQRQELEFARKNKLSVDAFARHLKGADVANRNQKIKPTYSDAAAVTFMKRCDELLAHTALKDLLSSDPPEIHREALVKKMKDLADELNKAVNELQEHWLIYEPLPPGLGFQRKEDYEEYKRHQAAKSDAAAAGSGR